jgi:membrane-associated phospholipid phosphatase
VDYLNVSWRRAVAWPALITLFCFGACILVGLHLHVSIRDPRGGFWLRVASPAVYLAAAIAADVAWRRLWAWKRGGSFEHHWTRARIAWTGFAFFSFQLTYLAYRNLKSWVPLGRNADFDRQLAQIDRQVFGHAGASEYLADMFGRGWVATLLDLAYVAYLPLVAIALAVGVTWLGTLRMQAAFLSAYLLNWSLGAALYWLVPAVGPAFVDSGRFSWLTDQAAGSAQLQSLLLTKRLDLLADPLGSGVFQSIGAFPSLHTSVTVTWTMLLWMFGYRRAGIVAGVYSLLVMLATLYLGWHYLADVAGGLGLALVSCAAAFAVYRPVRPAPGATDPARE